MRKPIIIGNWKMNLTLQEAKELFSDVQEGTREVSEDKVDIVACPTYLQISVVSSMLKGRVALGAQDVFWEDIGAFTGEISPTMLTDTKCEYVIVGHSERRQNLGETDEMVGQKAVAVLNSDLKPIVCIGESGGQRENGETDAVLKKQLLVALENVGESKFGEVIIAYEPIWAIGSGNPATPSDAEKVADFIREIILKKHSKELAENCRILYGGSVDPSNIQGFMKERNIDGALVGGASIKAQDFVDIVKNSIK